MEALKPVQWFKNGDHPDDYAHATEGMENGSQRTFTGEERKARGWEGDVVRYFRHPAVSGEKKCDHCGQTMHDHGWIDHASPYPEGQVVCPGDFIVEDEAGKHIAVHPEGFPA